MKNFLDKKFEIIFTIIVIFAMVSIPLLEFYGEIFWKIHFFWQDVIINIIGLIAIFFILLFLILKVFKNENSKIVLSDIFIIISIIFCLISFAFSKDKFGPVHQKYTYTETLLQVFTYFALFFMCSQISNKKYKKLILLTFIILAVFESIIAFLQNYKIWPMTSYFDSDVHSTNHLAFGLTEHCNFFAALTVIFTGIAVGSFFYCSKNKFYTILFFLLSIITCASSLFTYTRLSYIGLFSIIFALFFIEFFKNIRSNNSILVKKFLILICLFIIILLVIGISSGQLFDDLYTTTKEILSLTSNFNEFATSRGVIWKVGINALKKYPLTGVGFDNYRYSFEIYPEDFGWSQNKGHNEYLHIFVTQGIPSGINYLAFCFYCLYFPLKNLSNKNDSSKLTNIFLIALFAYFVQALFNSSVINVAPYKWILMGLVLTRENQKNLLKTKMISKLHLF